MAGTVRISQLSEVTNLAADGVIIVNTDFNTDTRTITFENFQKSYGAVKSINGQQPDATYAVTLTPAIIGTYSTAEIDAALANKVDLTEYNTFRLQVSDLQSFVGSNGISSIQPNIWKLPALQAAAPTELFSAVKVLDGALELTDLNLVQLNLDVTAANNAIGLLQTDVGTLTTDLETLEGIVNGTNGLNDGVSANETAIEQNATRIDSINAAVGVAAGSYADNIAGSIPNSGVIAGATTVTGALTLLNTQVGSNQTKVAEHDSTFSSISFTRARMHANTAHIYNKIISACSSLAPGASANDLATALVAELGNLPNPNPETP